MQSYLRQKVHEAIAICTHPANEDGQASTSISAFGPAAKGSSEFSRSLAAASLARPNAVRPVLPAADRAAFADFRQPGVGNAASWRSE